MTFYGVPPMMPAPLGGYDYGPAGGLAMMGAAPAVLAPPAIPDEVLRQQAAAVLQHCYRWLEAAVPILPTTAELVPVLVTAVQQYEAQQYDACLAQVASAVQVMRQLRLAVPALPPL